MLALFGAMLLAPATTQAQMAGSDPGQGDPATAIGGPTAPAPGVAGAAAGAATAAAPPDAVAAVARTLNCPICQGYTLQDCPLEVCAQMRVEIASQLARGRSADEIRAAFVADYGPQVLNAPPTRGFFLAAWLTPVIALVLGAFAVAWIMQRTSRPGGLATSPPGTAAGDRGAGEDGPGPSDLSDYAARLDALAARDDAS